MKRALFLLLAAIATPVQGNGWRFRLDTQALAISTPDSQSREFTTDAGLLISADYLDDLTLAAGLDRIRVQWRGADASDYQNGYFSGRWQRYPDLLPGRVTLRLDGWSMQSRTDGVTVGTGSAALAVVSFAEYAGRYGLEFGAAKSRYAGGLEVTQWSPALGFKPFSRTDWLLLRGTIARYSEPDLVQEKSTRRALQARWTHYFEPGNTLALQNLWIDLKSGERIYYIDPDAAAVANLPDLFRQGMSLGMQWRLTSHWQLLLAGGSQRVLEDGAPEHETTFAYFDIVAHW